MSDTPISLNLAHLMGRPDRQKHNYFCAQSGEMAANVLGKWHKDGCKSIAIKTTRLDIQAPALATKLKLGLEWLVANTQDESAKRLFAEIFSYVRIKGSAKNSIVYIDKIANIMESMELVDTSPDVIVDLKQDLMTWLATDPALDATWRRDGFELDQEGLLWFREKVKDLEAQGYCGVVKIDRILIRRTPLEDIRKMMGGTP